MPAVKGDSPCRKGHTKENVRNPSQIRFNADTKACKGSAVTGCRVGVYIPDTDPGRGDRSMLKLPIETPRLHIRRFQGKDISAFVAFVTAPHAARNHGLEEWQTQPEGARVLFDHILSQYGSPQPLHCYALAERESDQAIGSCGYSIYAPGIAECYYGVNAGHEGKGLASEATRTLITSLLALPEIHEIRAYCAPENRASHRVAENAGMQERGIQRHANAGVDRLLFSLQQGNRETGANTNSSAETN